MTIPGTLDEDQVAVYAEQLGGHVLTNGVIICPGPGREDDDRSLMVLFNAAAADRFVIASSADDWQDCHDYIRRVCRPDDITQSRLFERTALEASKASRNYWAKGGFADRKYPQQEVDLPPPGDATLAERARRRRLR